MYSRPIIIAVLFAVTSLTAEAQSHRVLDKSDLDPPSLQTVLSGTQMNGDAVISQLLEVTTEIPLGPDDLLRGYERAMTAIAGRTSTELSGISQAVFRGELTRDEAEYLTQERYEVSMMQYQVLSTLHASLEHDIAEAASNRPHQQDVPDTAVDAETYSVLQGW